MILHNNKIILPAIAFFSIMLVWELLIYFGIVNPLFLPAPTSIALSLVMNKGHYAHSIRVTVIHILVGYFVGAGLAIPAGLIFGWNKKIDLLFSPIFMALSTIPVVTFLPLFILWFGLNEIPVYLCSTIAAFFPAFLNTSHGVKKIDKSFIEVAENFKIKSMNRKVVFPASLPYISHGLRQAIQVCFLVTPPAEMIMGDTGLGGYIWKNADLFRPELVILGMITLGVIGFAMYKIYELVEQRFLLKWMNVRGDAKGY